jgi:hypothetical protein
MKSSQQRSTHTLSINQSHDVFMALCPHCIAVGDRQPASGDILQSAWQCGWTPVQMAPACALHPLVFLSKWHSIALQSSHCNALPLCYFVSDTSLDCCSASLISLRTASGMPTLEATVSALMLLATAVCAASEAGRQRVLQSRFMRAPAPCCPVGETKRQGSSRSNGTPRWASGQVLCQPTWSTDSHIHLRYA